MNTIQTKDRLRRVFFDWPFVWSIFALAMILIPTYNTTGIVVLSMAYALLLLMTVLAFIPSLNRNGVVDKIQSTYAVTAIGYFLLVPFLSGLHNVSLIIVLVVAPLILFVLSQYYRRFTFELLVVLFIVSNAISLFRWITEGSIYEMTFWSNVMATLGVSVIVYFLKVMISVNFASKQVTDMSKVSTEGERCVTYSFVHKEGKKYLPIRRSENKWSFLVGGRNELLFNAVPEEELRAWFMNSEEMYQHSFYDEQTMELYSNEIWQTYLTFVECRLSLADGAVELQHSQCIHRETDWDFHFDVIRQRDRALIKRVKLEKMAYPDSQEARQSVADELSKIFTLFYGGHYAKYAQEAVLYEPNALSHRLANYMLSKKQLDRRQLTALLYLADEQSWLTNKKRLLAQHVWMIGENGLENVQLSEALEYETGLLAPTVEWDETAFSRSDYELIDRVLLQYSSYTAEQLDSYVRKSQYWQRAEKQQEETIMIGE